AAGGGAVYPRRTHRGPPPAPPRPPPRPQRPPPPDAPRPGAGHPAPHPPLQPPPDARALPAGRAHPLRAAPRAPDRRAGGRRGRDAALRPRLRARMSPATAAYIKLNLRTTIGIAVIPEDAPAQAQDDLLVRGVVGPYRLIAALGEGAMGKV